MQDPRFQGRALAQGGRDCLESPLGSRELTARGPVSTARWFCVCRAHRLLLALLRGHPAPAPTPLAPPAPGPTRELPVQHPAGQAGGGTGN